MILFASQTTRFVLLAGITLSLTQSHLAVGQQTIPPEKTRAELSNVLTLTVGGVSKQLSLSDLEALPQSRVTVHNGHNNREEVYTGVALCDLLSANGLPFSKATQSTYLHSYVRAQGTDFYFVIYSAAEISPDLNTSTAIVATRVDGHNLGQDGAFKLVSTGDKRPARWVRNLLSVTLVTLN